MGYAEAGYHEYVYEGPVKEFERVITNNWSSRTFAPSEKKARSNLAYQFKKQFGKVAAIKITLPGVIRRIK